MIWFQVKSFIQLDQQQLAQIIMDHSLLSQVKIYVVVIVFMISLYAALVENIIVAKLRMYHVLV